MTVAGARQCSSELGNPDFVIALPHEQPGLLLIGLGPKSNELLFLSTHSPQTLSVPDLVHVIQ